MVEKGVEMKVRFYEHTVSRNQTVRALSSHSYTSTHSLTREHSHTHTSAKQVGAQEHFGMWHVATHSTCPNQEELNQI